MPNASALLRDSTAAARAARLHHVSPESPGIIRARRGRGFVYYAPDGTRVESSSVLERLRSIAIPPAWTEVWICSAPNGHIQATGIDARGRKQYRYHSEWRRVRDLAKYDDVLAFAESLALLRERVNADLRASGMKKSKVVATVLRIMDDTHARVGNDRYATANKSYGLTTLLTKHARAHGSVVDFSFRSKGGKPYHASIRDKRLVSIVRRCADIPGQRLFQYLESTGEHHPISSTDINDYIRKATTQAFTAKEFRTWGATVSAAMMLFESGEPRSHAHGVRRVNAAIEEVAAHLNNTPAICRKSYVHPAIVESYLLGELPSRMRDCLARAVAKPAKWLRAEEQAVIAFFSGRAARESRRAA